MFVKVILSNLKGGSARIIERSACNFVGVGLSSAGCGNRIGQVVSFNFDKLLIENYLTVVARIPIFYANYIYINGTEFRNCSKAFCNNGIGSNFFTGVFINPFNKDLACDERILRHSLDSFAAGFEILSKSFYNRSVVCKNNERNGILIFELCNKSKIRRNGFAT